MSIVLVCGGRDYADKAFLERFMDREHGVHVLTHVIHGNYRGADKLAHNWALSRGVQPVACEANWPKQGRKAGPLRNRRMAELRPHWAYAFPGGGGTAGMVEILKEFEIEVFVVDPDKWREVVAHEPETPP
jgi:YspA, cpYpsA-related SLOG family